MKLYFSIIHLIQVEENSILNEKVMKKVILKSTGLHAYKIHDINFLLIST